MRRQHTPEGDAAGEQRLNLRNFALEDELHAEESQLHVLVAAMRAGAHDFIEKPFEPARLVEIARRAVALRPRRRRRHDDVNDVTDDATVTSTLTR